MAEPRHDLVITQYLADSPIEDVVAQLMKLLNSDNPRLEFKLSDALLFENGNSAALENITKEEAEEYQRQFLELMVESEIRPSLQVVTAEPTEKQESAETYTCPACGHKQPKQDKESGEGFDTCQSCGVIGEKYLKLKRKEDILEEEKRKNKAAQAQQVKEQLERARSDLEEKMRREARQELGLESEKGLVERFGAIALVVVGIAVVGNISFMLYNAQNKETAAEDEIVASAPATTESTGAQNAPNIENIPVAAQAQEIPPAKGGTIPASALANSAPDNAASAATGTASTVASESTQTTVEKGETNTNTDTATDGTNNASETSLASTRSDSNDNSSTTNTNNTSSSDSTQSEQQTSAVNGGGHSDSDIKSQLKNAVHAAYEKRGNSTSSTSLSGGEAVRQEINKEIKQFRYKQKQRFLSSNNEHQQHKDKIQRLLELERIDLATVFVQELDDKYEASVLLLDILKTQLTADTPQNTQAVIAALKELEELSRQPQQRALLSGSLCAAYSLMGNAQMADEMLAKSQKLASITTSPVERIKNLTQLANEQSHMGNTDFADTILNTAMPYAQQIDESKTMERALVFTHIAHSHAQLKQLSTAHTLLRNVSDDTARANLSAYFNEIQ